MEASLSQKHQGTKNSSKLFDINIQIVPTGPYSFFGASWKDWVVVVFTQLPCHILLGLVKSRLNAKINVTALTLKLKLGYLTSVAQQV